MSADAPNCSRFTAENYEARLLRMGEDLHLANLELAKYRREISRLKNELANRDKTSRLRPHAEEIFDFWKQHVRPGARTFGDKRMRCVISRLGEGGKDIEGRKAELKEAILGAATDAWVDPKTGVRYDDLELICRDDVNVQRFRDKDRARQERMGTVNDPRLSREEIGFLRLLIKGENPFKLWTAPSRPATCALCMTPVNPAEAVCASCEPLWSDLWEQAHATMRLEAMA
jgi:hypothetical protein